MKRPPRRYLLFRLVSDTAFSPEIVAAEIERSVREFFGDVNVLLAFPRLIAFDPKRMMGVVRCSSRWVDQVRAALALTVRIEGHVSAFLVVRSAGTIESLRKRFDPDGGWIGRRASRRRSS